VFDEGRHIERRGCQRGVIAGRDDIRNTYNRTIRVHERTEQDMAASQVAFAPRLGDAAAPGAWTGYRRGREDAPAVFTEFLRESVRKGVDLSATGHSV
jgi:hypothetical protein